MATNIVNGAGFQPLALNEADAEAREVRFESANTGNPPELDRFQSASPNGSFQDVDSWMASARWINLRGPRGWAAKTVTVLLGVVIVITLVVSAVALGAAGSPDDVVRGRPCLSGEESDGRSGSGIPVDGISEIALQRAAAYDVLSRTGTCIDTPDWTNMISSCSDEGHSKAEGCMDQGYNCFAYEKNNWCWPGGGDSSFLGSKMNYPELNCCVCGGGVTATELFAKTKALDASVEKKGESTSIPRVTWLPLGGSANHVAVDEGGPSSQGSAWVDLGKCMDICARAADCQSFTHCGGRQCYLKATKLEGNEPTVFNKDCTSYYQVSLRSGYAPQNRALAKESSAPVFTFYMYRAQRDTDYPPENVNMASLGGVLWYLHNELVSHCPRKFEVTRILRYKVSTRATQPLFDIGMNFGPRYAFDSGRCTGPWSCQKDTWTPYGYVVGCNNLTKDKWPFPTWKVAYPNATWYSIPGPCPSQTFFQRSTKCAFTEPGGICEGPPTGMGDCTFSYEKAGDIRLDDVVGIHGDDSLHNKFCKHGCREYEFSTDRGRCNPFWDRKRSWPHNVERMRIVAEAFAKKYPDTPHDQDIPPPICDFDYQRFYHPHASHDVQQDVETANGFSLQPPRRVGNRSRDFEGATTPTRLFGIDMGQSC